MRSGYLNSKFHPDPVRTGIQKVEFKVSYCTQISPSWWLEFKSGVKVKFKWSFEVEFRTTSCHLVVSSTSVFWDVSFIAITSKNKLFSSKLAIMSENFSNLLDKLWILMLMAIGFLDDEKFDIMDCSSLYLHSIESWSRKFGLLLMWKQIWVR